MIERVDPFQLGVPDGFEIPPRATMLNDLGFVEAAAGFDEGGVVGIANVAHRGVRTHISCLDRDRTLLTTPDQVAMHAADDRDRPGGEIWTSAKRSFEYCSGRLRFCFAAAR